MHIPVEIFNEIAKYFIGSFDELGIILSLSQEITEYIEQPEIIKKILPINMFVSDTTKYKDSINILHIEIFINIDDKIMKIKFKTEHCSNFSYLHDGLESGILLGDIGDYVEQYNDSYEIYYTIYDDDGFEFDTKFLGIVDQCGSCNSLYDDGYLPDEIKKIVKIVGKKYIMLEFYEDQLLSVDDMNLLI